MVRADTNFLLKSDKPSYCELHKRKHMARSNCNFRLILWQIMANYGKLWQIMASYLKDGHHIFNS